MVTDVNPHYPSEYFGRIGWFELPPTAAVPLSLAEQLALQPEEFDVICGATTRSVFGPDTRLECSR
jgi:hypothetical protein